MHATATIALRLVLVMAGLALVSLARAQEAPFLARVGVDGAGVFHAPDGYSTGELDPGALVQVLRRQGTQWLAIRPPEGSFGWIPGRDVQPDDGQVKAGTVVGRAVPVLIGTPLDIETLESQVKLSKGDRVEILGSEQLLSEDETTTETWYKIVPPAHEVRWVRTDEIELPQPDPAPAIAGADPDAILPPPPGELLLPATIRPVAGEEPIDERGPRPVGTSGMKLEPLSPATRTSPAAVELNASPTPLPKSEGWRPARLTGRPPSATPARAGSTESWNLTDGASQGPSAARLLPPSASGQPLSASGPFQRQLEELEVRLARTTASDPAQWRLDLLRRDAERLVSAGTTLIERGQARLLLEKVAELDDWRARYEKMLARQALPGPSVAAAPTRASFGGGAAPPAPLNPSPRSPLGPAGTLIPPATSGSPPPSAGPPAEVPPMAGASALDAPGLPDYSGRGYLMPIVTSRPDIPRYALVDEQGQVLQFVTPAPGVNIARYLRRPVGINGRVDQPPQLNKPHLTAERVIELDRHIR